MPLVGPLARRLLGVATLALPALAAGQPIGVLTIVDGEIIVLREAAKFRGAPGLRLQTDDIVHSRGDARLARIEFAGGGGVIDLGPATKLLLHPLFAPPEARAAAAYLLQGSAKLASAPGDAGAKPVLASPALDVRASGSVVVQVTNDSTFAFVEAGSALLTAHADGKPAGSHALAEGDTWVAPGASAAKIVPRPPLEFRQALPRAFADSLPLLASRFAAIDVEPAGTREIDYADVAAWIDAEPALRPAFRQRWVAKAREPAFRAALVAGLAAHPEWRTLLQPERRAPRRVVAVARKPVPPPLAIALALASEHAADRTPSTAWPKP